MLPKEEKSEEGEGEIGGEIEKEEGNREERVKMRER